MLLVQHILSEKKIEGVLTVKPTDTIESAVQLLSEKRIGALIVSVDGKKVSGILSERDIVSHLGQEGVSVLSKAVGDLMTSKVQATTMSTPAVKVLAQMTAGRFRHMPVLDESDNLVAVVSIGDAVKARIKEIEHENEALAGMIAGF